MNSNYFIEHSQERLKATILRNKHQSRTFHTSEKMNEIARLNINLFKKIDNLHNGRLRPNSKRILNHVLNKTPSNSGSLNIFAKKREAQRIDNENKKMASRLIGTNGLYSPHILMKDEIRTNKLRQLIKKSSSSQLSIKHSIDK